MKLLQKPKSELKDRDKVLICALALEEQEQVTYTQTELSVMLWKKYPSDFGIKGYETEYPDTHHTVLAILKAIKTNKLLQRDELYMLSVSGRAEAYKIATEHNIQTTHKGAFSTPKNVPSHIQKLVERLLDSEAYYLKRQQDYSYTFLCACKFWGMSELAKGQEITETLTAFKGALLTAASAVTSQVKFDSGRVVTRKEIYDLLDLSNTLEIRCRKYLTLMMERK